MSLGGPLGTHDWVKPASGEIFWAIPPVDILVFASPTGYMLTSSGFPSLNWDIISINSSKMIER